MLSQLFNKLSANPQRLFLIDGFGALLSAFFLGVVLVKLESIIGMPRKGLYFLAALPCLFAIYDFWYYFNFSEKWQAFLKGIALANLMYCVISIGLLFYHFEKLSHIGFAYFISEIIVLIFLVTIEIKVARQPSNSFITK